MPTIDSLKISKNKKFTKKEYRPWDQPLVKYPNENNESSEGLKDLKNNKEQNTISKNPLREVVKGTENLDLIRIQRRLYGPQKKVLNYLINNFDFENQEKVFLKPIVYVEVSTVLNITIPTLKSVLSMFKKSGLVTLHDYKPGRGGYGCYTMHKNIFSFFSNVSKEISQY